MNSRQVMSRLEREGWSGRTGKGSHVVYCKEGRPNVIVSHHTGDIAPGTLRSICKAAGWEYPPER